MRQPARYLVRFVVIVALLATLPLLAGPSNPKNSPYLSALADLVMLSADIFSIDPRAIKDVKAVTTITGGRVVWDSSTGAEHSPSAAIIPAHPCRPMR